MLSEKIKQNRSLIFLIFLLLLFATLVHFLPKMSLNIEQRYTPEDLIPEDRARKLPPGPPGPQTPPPPSPEKPPLPEPVPEPPEVNEPAPAPEQSRAAEPETPEPEASVPDVDVAAFKAIIPEGGALLTGGWERDDGSRTFALVSPIPTNMGGGPVVMVKSQMIAIAPEHLEDPSWEAVLTPSENGMHLNGATYSAEELQAFRTRYMAKDQVELLSAPTVVTRYGSAATIQVAGTTAGSAMSILASEAAEGTELGVSMLNWQSLHLVS